MVKVSVIIKALNEEANIARAIESSLKAVAPYGGEVIVADSASSDGTVDRAVQFPIATVQLDRPEERCCGVGAQLGYQHSRGEYVYILDGDMELDAGFIRDAILLMEREPSLAGVGGYVQEMRVENLEFKARVMRQHRRHANEAVDVKSLAGGGLYRRAAIEDVGYLTDRNLHSFEEYDLGVRLRKKRWRMVRLTRHAADHYSYAMKTYSLLWSRIRSGYVLGVGELLRAAIAGRYLGHAVLELNALRIALLMWPYWGGIVLLTLWLSGTGLQLAVPGLALLLPILAMAVRTRSLRLGAHSVLLWHVTAVSLIAGLVRTRKSPTARVESCEIHRRIDDHAVTATSSPRVVGVS